MSAQNSQSENNRLQPDPTQALRLARERVGSIRRTLETPSARALHEVVPCFYATLADLREFCAAPPSVRNRELLAFALELQREVRGLEALLDACGEFSAGWAAVLWGLGGDYAADGSQRPRVTGRRVSLEG
jgi:hypothetical protein